MGRRGTIIILIILITGIAALLIIFQQGRNNIFTDPYKAIPTDACFILESADLPSFLNNITEESPLFKELNNVKEFNSFNTSLKYLSGLINGREYDKIFEKSTSLVSFHFEEKGKLVPLLAMSVPPEIRIRHIRGLLTSTFFANIKEKKNQNDKLFEISYPFLDTRDTLYLSFDSGLIICSPSELQISKALKQRKSRTDIRDLPGFSKIIAASGKKVDKVFLVFSNISKLIRSMVPEKDPGLAEEISKLAICAEADIYFNEGGVLLSGYTECPDSSSTLYRYKFYQPGILDQSRILPAVTWLFETIVLPDSANGKSFNSSASDSSANLASLLRPYIGEEITKAYLDLKDNRHFLNSLIIYELKNREVAEAIFNDWIGRQNTVTLFQPDEQTRIPIYSTSFPGLISGIAPGFAPGKSDSVFAFYDKYLITGNSGSVVSRFLYDNMLKKTLANDAAYKEFESTMPGRAGYFFFCVPAKLITFLSDFLNDTIIKSLSSNLYSLKKFQAVGYQFTPSNGMIYNTLSVRYKDEVREESGTEWETLLDTSACIKPFFFTNHITGAKEVFVQDYKNNAYLINSAGRVMWKVPLKERILSNVFMIDYYGNGKFQLLFSGRNNLHLLDRNGNYVERYPVSLRSPASGPIALFDYDGNHDYRIVISGDDKLIYAYDKSGNVVKGWKPFRTNGIVKAEIKYFRVSGKDFLVASDEISVYFLDRTGSPRLKLLEPVTRAKGSEIRLTSYPEQALVFTSPDGTLQTVTFDGAVKKTTLKRFSGDHSFDFFDLDGDGYGEYIFIDRGILYLYNHNKQEIFTRNLGSTDLAGPICLIFSATNRKIGIYDNNKKLIYLLNIKGQTMEGFPLRGASMFSIGKFSEKVTFTLLSVAITVLCIIIKLVLKINKYIMNKIPFIFLIMMLVLIPSGCVKSTYDLNKLSNKNQYSPAFATIAAQGDISLRDLLKPGDTVRYDTDKFVRIVFRKDSVINFKLSDYLNFNNMVTFGKGYKVGDLVLSDFQSSLAVSLGTISNFFSPALKAQFSGLNGTTNNFPSFPQTDIGETTFTAPSNFQNAVFSSGTLTLSVKNNLTAPLGSIKITLYNSVGHTIIGSQVTVPAINPGATQSASIDLTGKTLTNSMVAAIILTGSPGTSSPVLINLNSTVQVTMDATNLKVQSGRVKLPSQPMNASDTVSMLDFNPGTGIEIERLRVLTGSIGYTLISRTGVTGSLTFSFPTSPAISKTIAINGNSTVSGTISLNNTDADLSTDPTQRFNRIPGKYLITLNSNGNFIDFNKNDSVHIDVNMQNPNFDYVKGYFGQQNQLVPPDVLSTGIEDILKNITGQFHVTSPSIRLNYSNSFGVPIQVTLNATGKKNTQTVDLGLAPFSILSPTTLAVRDVSSTFTIDKNNSALSNLVSLPPSEIDFSGSAKMNPAGPDGLRNNYIFGNSRFLGSMEVEVPLDFWVNNMQFADTLDNFLKPDNNSNNSFSASDVDSLQIKIVANNGFPLGASVKMMLYDSIHKVVIKTIDASNLLSPAPVDSNGKSTGKTESTTSLNFSKTFFDSINSANKIIIMFTLNTTGNGSQSVKIYSDYSITFKASVLARPRVKL